MQSTLLAPEPQVEESSVPHRTVVASAALVAGAASLELALVTDATMVAAGLAALGILLAVSAIAGAREHRGRLIALILALILSVGSIGALIVAGVQSSDDAAGAARAAEAVASEVSGSPVELTMGTVTTDTETQTSSVVVSVTNVTEQPVSTWASISATSPKGKKTYAAQGVGVRDLEPGQTSTQRIYFDAVLPEKAVFVVKDVL